MDKRRAIQIMTKAAQLYKEHLEDQKVLFLYGLPKEVNKQLQESNKILSSVQGYEVVFHISNFCPVEPSFAKTKSFSVNRLSRHFW